MLDDALPMPEGDDAINPLESKFSRKLQVRSHTWLTKVFMSLASKFHDSTLTARYEEWKVRLAVAMKSVVFGFQEANQTAVRSQHDVLC